MSPENHLEDLPPFQERGPHLSVNTARSSADLQSTAATMDAFTTIRYPASPLGRRLIHSFTFLFTVPFFDLCAPSAFNSTAVQ